MLEQLADPFAVLRRHATRLSRDGIMLLCVSNVEHWSLTERLLRGSFRHEDTGLLDRRHRHWFSLESMREGLRAAGINVKLPDLRAAEAAEPAAAKAARLRGRADE